MCRQDVVSAAEGALIGEWQRRRRVGDPSAGELAQFLIEANRSLLARTWRRRARRLDRSDLDQAAHLGLLTALERFRPGRGVPFGPYALTWIRKEKQRTVAAGDFPIAVPSHRLADLDRAGRSDAVHRARTDAQLAAELQISRATAAGLRTVVTMRPPDAVSEPIDPADEIAQAELRIAVAEALTHLTPREVRVVELRYGLRDGRLRTLRQVAAELGVSDFTVRADLARAHERLARRLA